MSSSNFEYGTLVSSLPSNEAQMLSRRRGGTAAENKMVQTPEPKTTAGVSKLKIAAVGLGGLGGPAMVALPVMGVIACVGLSITPVGWIVAGVLAFAALVAIGVLAHSYKSGDKGELSALLHQFAWGLKLGSIGIASLVGLTSKIESTANKLRLEAFENWFNGLIPDGVEISVESSTWKKSKWEITTITTKKMQMGDVKVEWTFDEQKVGNSTIRDYNSDQIIFKVGEETFEINFLNQKIYKRPSSESLGGDEIEIDSSGSCKYADEETNEVITPPWRNKPPPPFSGISPSTE